jgi:drug/metabolite transporter (DMT)-like permease
MRTPALFVGVAMLGALGYGTNGPYAVLAAAAGFSTEQMAFWRSAILLAIGTLFLVVSGGPRALALARPGQVLLIGALSAALALAYLTSVSIAPVAIVVAIFYTYPLIVMAAEAALDRRPPPLARVAAAVVAFFGLLLAVGPSSDAIGLAGVAVATLTALLCAALNLAAGRGPALDAAGLNGVQAVIVPFTALAMLITGRSFDPGLMALAPVATVISVIGYIVGFTAMLVAAPRLGATAVSLIFLIEPIVAIIAAAALLDQWPAPTQWLGVLIILAALAFDALWRARRPPDGQPRML